MEEVPSELIPPSVQLRREEQISELPNSELLEHEGESEQEPDTADEVTDPDAQEDSKDRISVIEMLAEHASRPGSNHDVHDVDRGWEAPNEQDATVAQGVPKDGGA